MKIKFLILCIVLSYAAKAQNATAIIGRLRAQVIAADAAGCTQIITTGALNKFFADKVASYLSEGGDLSLFKQYATLNSADGKLSVNWNLKPTKDTYGRITRFFTLGFKTNAADGFATIFSNKKFSDEIGLSFKHTWIGRGAISFDNCRQIQRGAALVTGPMKRAMILERYVIFKQLEAELNQKELEFNASINTGNVDYPAGIPTAERAAKVAEFFSDLDDEYTKKLAELEAAAIEKTKSYHRLSDYWFTLSAYIPLTKQDYMVAPTFTSVFAAQSHYPWEISFSANRITESKTAGRFFFNLTGALIRNNTVKTEDLTATTVAEYKKLGGVDTLKLASLTSQDSYVGAFENFITPSLRFQVVYFPPKWDIGASVQFDKKFMKYDPLDLKLGIPFYFKDKDGEATVNFELQYKVPDIAKNLSANKDKSWGERSIFGVSVGLPFSSLLY